MSSESVIALVAIVTSGVLGVASLAFSFWNSSSERRQRLKERSEDNREWYARNFFEKRVEAAQGAKRWLSQLDLALPHVRPGDFRSPSAERLDRIIAGAKEWYHTVSFYLPEDLQGYFWGFLNQYENNYSVGTIDETVLWDKFFFPAQQAFNAFESELKARESSLEAVRARERRYLRRFLGTMGIDTSDMDDQNGADNRPEGGQA